MHLRFIFIVGTVLCLSACSNSTDVADVVTVPATTLSGFVEGDTIPEFLTSLNGAEETTSRSLDLGIANGPGGYRVAIGRFEEADSMEYAAYAMLQSATGVSGPVTGNVTYQASYLVLEVQDVASNPLLSETETVTGGAITLTAAFGDQTINGTSDLLTIDATLDNDAFAGTVTWRGVEGAIEGLATDSFMIGAFHGHDENAVFAGGISGGGALN